jgi:hypothetical protein
LRVRIASKEDVPMQESYLNLELSQR